MLLFNMFVGCFAAALFSGPVSAVDKDADPALVASLRLAPTMLDRLKLLSDEQLLYNFSSNPMFSQDPETGSVCNANTATFPALTGGGMTVAQLNLGPCAMLAPHLHRAMNLVVAVKGRTHTFMVQENGARLVQQYLSPGMMTIFPAASLHSMVNEGCGYNQLYSFLSSDDPGTLNVANNLWLFGPDIGMRVLPMLNANAADWNMTGQEIPSVGTGATSGYQACLQRCGLVDTGPGWNGTGTAAYGPPMMRGRVIR